MESGVGNDRIGEVTLVELSDTWASEIVVQPLWGIAAIIAVFLCFFLGWRWASRQWQLPCPSLLSWALETRLYNRLSGTSATLDRMKLEPGQRILEIGPGPGRLLIPAAKRVQPGGDPHYQSWSTVERLAEEAGFQFESLHGHWWFFTANFVKPSNPIEPTGDLVME
jgi:hypothetical protein